MRLINEEKRRKAALKALLEVKAATLHGETKHIEHDNLTVTQWLDSTPDQLSILLDSIKQKNIAYYSLFLTIAYTGMRKGEALGLQWRNAEYRLCQSNDYHWSY